MKAAFISGAMGMCRFELSIKAIEHGWAELLLLLDGHELTFCFEQEYLSVKKLEDNLCRVEAECACVDLPVKQFCKAILRMFDAYVFAFSRDEYSRNWYAFPGAELERLRALYHAA